MGRASRGNRGRREQQSLSEHTGSGHVSQVIQQSTTLRHGPLPDAEELQRYENIQPGFAERIMAMAEREATTRQTMIQNAQQAEIADLRSERIERRMGQILGFLLACAALGLAGYAAHIDRPWVASFVAALSIGSICLALILGRRPHQ